MTNGEEESRDQAITEAIEALRNLRGRMAPPGNAETGDQTKPDPDQEPGSAVVEDTADVGSKGAEEETTQGTVSTEEGETPEEWETQLDRRVETFKKVTKADVKSDWSDLRQDIVDKVSDLRTQIILAVVAIVATGLLGVWQMGEAWKEDVRESFQEFRQDIGARIERLDQAGDRREDRIEKLDARTDSLMNESR